MSDGSSGPILLVDTYSLFFRAFHALPAMNTASGEPTSALYGFCAVLLKELRERSPSGIAFAVDAPKKTFRHERFAGYKAQREALPSPLVVQLGRLRELLAAFDAPVFCVPGFEADDVLATLCHALREQSTTVLVMSGDRDLLQVVRGGVSVLFLGARGQKPVVYDTDRVVERFGVPPASLPSWAALVGDPSDNLPGIDGVGPRTASSWVKQFGTVAALLEHIDQIKPARLRPELAARREQLLLNEDLATLRVDVPLPEGPRSKPIDARAFAQLRALFTQLEFKSLIPRLEALGG